MRQSHLGQGKLDLRGQKFSRLKVIDYADDHKTKSGRLLTMYECLCDCGNRVVQYSSALRKEAVKSCGCLNQESRAKIGRANKGRKRPDMKGENNHMWKGNEVGYFALHAWVKRNYEKPTKCDFCHRKRERIEWANVSREYKRDRNDFYALCKPCHIDYDKKYKLLQDAD